jgi:hypothetical protein
MDQVVGQALATFRRIEGSLPKADTRNETTEATGALELAG